jgi:cytochrome P450
MRLLNGNLESLQDEFELVTFGHGQKRCIGEKMARAMICAFLAEVLPHVDADTPADLPEDGFFDLIPASQLRIYNPRQP